MIKITEARRDMNKALAQALAYKECGKDQSAENAVIELVMQCIENGLIDQDKLLIRVDARLSILLTNR